MAKDHVVPSVGKLSPSPPTLNLESGKLNLDSLDRRDSGGDKAGLRSTNVSHGHDLKIEARESSGDSGGEH